jgi:hypothetical protein
MTSSVKGRLCQAEAQVWQRVEKLALDKPNAARLLAIPAGLYELVKSIILPPVQSVEHLVLAGKAIVDYTREKDKGEKKMILDLFKSYLCYAGVYLVLTPFSAVIGCGKAAATAIRMGISPLKMAKIQCARAQVTYRADKSMKKNIFDPSFFHSREAFRFATEATLERFERRVLAAKHDEIDQLDFVDTKEARTNTMKEIRLKSQKCLEAMEIRNRKLQEVVEKLKNAKHEDQVKMWKEPTLIHWEFAKFKDEMGKADIDEAEAMEFDPLSKKEEDPIKLDLDEAV